MHILARHGARTVTDTGPRFGELIHFVAPNLLVEYHCDISIGYRDIDCQTWSKIDFFHIFDNFDVSYRLKDLRYRAQISQAYVELGVHQENQISSC